jgi:hypothetical protein
MATPLAFLSHTTKDADLAGRLARDLIEAGVDVWYSEWEMKLGDSLRRRIEAGIDKATHFMVLLTPASLASEWVQTELDTGLVNRIAGKCRLIPILSDISIEQVPATLRGVLGVRMDPYADGLRKLIDACHDVSAKPPLGEAPTWARERPLPRTGLSTNAQRLATWLNEHSEDGHSFDIFERDPILKDLDFTADQAGMAASELSDAGMVKLTVTSGSGPARFSAIQPKPQLFFRTDLALCGWDTKKDALALAAAMVNSGGDQAALADMDRQLGWGPRRINPAADYLSAYGYVERSKSFGSLPYTFSHAFLTHRTRRFVESSRGG